MKSINPKVEILMATYNGEDYIVDQIESLFNQTYQNWSLLIRDDGSKDKTLEIIETYEKKFPDKIRLLRDEKGGLRAQYNFLELLKNSEEDYVMFCDQDDIWLENKIKKTLDTMLQKEKKGKPTLIYSDLSVVDSNLNLISDSFWKFQRMETDLVDYKTLILQNHITGCTIMINRELKILANLGYENVIMHDWLIGILAILNGEIYKVEEPLILYRQHEKNCAGAKKKNETLIDLIKKIKILDKQIKDSKKQIKSILEKIEISNEKKIILMDFINLDKKRFFERRKWLLNNDFTFRTKKIKKIIHLILG